MNSPMLTHQANEMPDFITEKVYYITSLSGIYNLSVSKSINRLLVRFHDQFYENQLDSYILHLRTRLDVIRQRVYIVSLTEKSFYVHEFLLQSQQLHQLNYLQNVQIESVNFAFYPQIILKSKSQQLIKQLGNRDYYVYNLKLNNFEAQQPSMKESEMQKDEDYHRGIYYFDNSKFIKQAQTQNKLFYTTQTANHEMYIVSYKNNIFMFDLQTHQQIGKIKLQKPFISRLEYINNIDKYFLFIVYDDLVLEIKQLIKINQGSLITVLENKTQLISLQQVNTKIQLKNIYFQKLLVNSDSIYYALIVKIKIEEKSRLFIKNLLIFDDNQVFHIYDQKQLLYLNVKSSLIQPSQYNNSILFMIDNRVYLTHNMRVCNGICECDSKYNIVSSTFQQTKQGEFILMCAQQNTNILIKKVAIEKTVSEAQNENILKGELQLQDVSSIITSIQDLDGIELDQNRCQILSVGQNKTYYVLLHNYMLKVELDEQKYQICNIEEYYDNLFVRLVTYGGKFYLVTIKNITIYLYKINDLELTLETSIELDQRPLKIQYQQAIGAIIIQYDNTNSSQISIQSMSSQTNDSKYLHRIIYIDNLYNEEIYADFQLNDFKNKFIINLDNRKFTTVEKSQYGLAYDNICDIGSDPNPFIKSSMTYPAPEDVQLFTQIQNNYAYQEDGEELDQNLQFDQFSNMFKNAINIQYKFADIIAVFLSMNQLKVVDQITKFNKNEVSPWLRDYYMTLDPVNKPTPRISLDKIENSYLLYLAPVYHLPDILFQAAQEDFKLHRDPLNVAFYFVITNKISLLANLFKLTKQDKIYEFLKRDFNDPKNQQAAVKNAYTLVSKHNFLLAATWFIIGRQFKEGIQLLYQEKYLNNKFLAMRCIQMLYIQQNITKEQAHEMYAQIVDDLDISFEGLGDLQALIRKQIVEQFIYNYQQKDYFAKIQNMLEIICFARKKQLINYTEDDIAFLSTYLMCNHYFYQNIKLSKIIIQFCRTFMLLVNNNLLRIVYTRIVLDIGQRPLAMYSYKADQKSQILNQNQYASESDIEIEKIAQHYEEGFVTETTYQLGHNHKFDTLIQLLYSQSKYFTTTFSNSRYVRIGMQDLYHANIYHMHRQLSVSFQDLVILYIAIQILAELLQADEQQFNIYSKIIENYCQKYGVEDIQEKSAGTFQQAYKSLCKYGYSNYEKKFLNNLLNDVCQQDLNTVGILIEQEIYYIIRANLQFLKMEDAKLYVDSLSVHQKNVVITQQHLQRAKISQDAQPVIHLIQTHPLIILLYDTQLKNLHLIRYNNASQGLDFVQVIPATEFVLGKNTIIVLHDKQIKYYVYTFDNQLQNNQDTDNKKCELDTVDNLMKSQIISCQQVKLEQVWMMQLSDIGFKFTVQKSLHKIIAINRETLILQFMDKMENQFDSDVSQRNISRVFKKKVIQDIVSIHIIDEYLVVIMFNSLDRQYVFYLRVSDILYEENLSTYQLLELTAIKYDKMSCFSKGGVGYIILSNALQYTTYEIQGPEYSQLSIKELHTNKLGPKKNRIYLTICEQDGDVCCSNYVVRSIFKGELPIDQCPICGKIISTEGQINQLHDYKVVLGQ